MLKRLAFCAAIAIGASAARAEEMFPMYLAADRDPDAFTKALLARPTFADTFPGAVVDFNGSVAQFYVPMAPQAGVLYATLAAASAVVWATATPRAADDDYVAEVAVRFEWNDHTSLEVDFPETQFPAQRGAVWIHGTLDRAAVFTSSAGAEAIWPSCLRWYGRVPKFCAAVATFRAGYMPPI
jgi:hypothetical protein